MSELVAGCHPRPAFPGLALCCLPASMVGHYLGENDQVPDQCMTNGRSFWKSLLTFWDTSSKWKNSVRQFFQHLGNKWQISAGAVIKVWDEISSILETKQTRGKKKIQTQFIDTKERIELVKIGKSSKVNWSMNSVGMGSDEIYFCMPFKTLNSVALEMELKKKKHGWKLYWSQGSRNSWF